MGSIRSRFVNKKVGAVMGVLLLILLAGHFIPVSSKYIGMATDPCGTSDEKQTLRYEIINNPFLPGDGNSQDYTNSSLPPLITNANVACTLEIHSIDVQYYGKLYLW